MKFGQQGETKSCMQEYNLGDFSKFYPQNIFKLALNLYTETEEKEYLLEIISVNG